MKNKIDVKIGDIISQFVGNAAPSKYRQLDKLFISKYVVTDVIDSFDTKKKTIQIKQVQNNTIPKAANRFWFGDVITKYYIERTIE